MTAAPDSSLRSFFTTLACALAFIYYTSRTLPDVVASHFNSAGVATGFLPRNVYLLAMLAVVLVPPIFLVTLPRTALRNPRARINIPHRDYWLAPQRRGQTVEFIARQCTRFGAVLLVFLCYVHWMVVHANASIPPTLSSGWFLAGLVVFLGLTVRWAFGLINRFQVTEEEE
jgi:hypothetical protein